MSKLKFWSSSTRTEIAKQKPKVEQDAQAQLAPSPLAAVFSIGLTLCILLANTAAQDAPSQARSDAKLQKFSRSHAKPRPLCPIPWRGRLPTTPSPCVNGNKEAGEYRSFLQLSKKTRLTKSRLCTGRSCSAASKVKPCTRSANHSKCLHRCGSFTLVQFLRSVSASAFPSGWRYHQDALAPFLPTRGTPSDL